MKAWDIFGYERNVLGNANQSGEANLWWRLEEDLRVRDQEESYNIPLRVQKSGKQKLYAGSGLGEGWWIPMLESSVVQLSDDAVRMTTIAGGVVYLYKTSEFDYASKTGSWKAQLDSRGEGRLQMIDQKYGWVFDFAGGSLSKLTTPGGKTLNWIGSPEKGFVRIAENGSRGAGLLEAKYEQGLLRKLAYGDDYQIEFSYRKLPIMAEGFVVDLVDVMDRYVTNFGYEAEFVPIEFGEATNSGRKGIRFANYHDGERVEQGELVWLSDTGRILRRDQAIYEVVDVNSEDGKYPLIRLTDSGGKSESYQFFPKALAVERGYKDGGVVRRQFVGIPGAGFGKVGKIMVKGDGDEFEEVYSAMYNEFGGVLREEKGIGGVRVSVTYVDGLIADLKPIDDGGIVQPVESGEGWNLFTRYGKFVARIMPREGAIYDEVVDDIEMPHLMSSQNPTGLKEFLLNKLNSKQ
ncbi:MAG: hypothetical protein HRU46_07895 [Verrucomicrobiales bacterium]|nr:hypothetical protein [Verrucomicrobiales bacterium]